MITRPSVIIAPVGRQPMPVLLPILQFRPRASEPIVSRETAAVRSYIADALERDPETAGIHFFRGNREVPAYGAAATEQLVRRIAGDPRYAADRADGRVVVNISGGTTIMATGARLAAEQLGLPLLYVDSDAGQLLRLSPRGEELAREELFCRVGVERYLRAHGAYLLAERDGWGAAFAQGAAWMKALVALAGRIAGYGPHSVPLLDAVRGCYANGQDGGILRLPDHAHSAALAGELLSAGLLREVGAGEVGLLPEQDEWGRRARRFLCGHWLELYVSAACRQQGGFDDLRVGARYGRQARPRPIENEIDVLVTRRGALAAISCKTGRELTATGDALKRKLAVAELSNLVEADLMGLYARKLLVTNQIELSEDVRARAYVGRIELIDGRDLADAARRIEAFLRAPQDVR